MKALLGTPLLVAGLIAGPQVGDWPIHDRSRPAPPVVEPGTASTEAEPGRPPSDAVVLFDGKDLSAWRDPKSGGPARWAIREGALVVTGGTGGIETVRAFGDCQLHLEWATPAPPEGEDQDRGNSGVYLMGLYELQILDSYRSATYPDGQAAAIFGQYPPLVNASRPPGVWQSYDVVFHRPRFGPDRNLLAPARMTVLHNGVLVQDDAALTGPTAYKHRPPYAAHPDRLPLFLQDHGHPVRFRNIWIRELP